jgi:hypothetical protein
MVKTNFRLHDYGRGILHITNPDSKELAYAFLRIQESSTNPKWVRRKSFSREQYLSWYDNMRALEPDPRWEFDKEYVGFSAEFGALIPFYEGKFGPLEKEENGLLDLLAKPTNRGRKTGFINGTTEGDLYTMRHELSIAFSHVDPSYRRDTLKVMRAIPADLRAQMDEWFINDGSFMRKDIPDQIVAEFADWVDSYMFKEAGENGIDRRNRILQRVHTDIRALYEAELKTIDLTR